MVEGVALGPGDGGVAAEGEVDVGVDAFQVGFEGLQEGVELGAFDGGDPADDAVEFFVAFLGGEEEEEVHGGVYVFGVAGDAELEAAAGGFVDAAFDDFAVDGVVAGGEGEVHDADFKLLSLIHIWAVRVLRRFMSRRRMKRGTRLAIMGIIMRSRRAFQRKEERGTLRRAKK